MCFFAAHDFYFPFNGKMIKVFPRPTCHFYGKRDQRAFITMISREKKVKRDITRESERERKGFSKYNLLGISRLVVGSDFLSGSKSGERWFDKGKDVETLHVKKVF